MVMNVVGDEGGKKRRGGDDDGMFLEEEKQKNRGKKRPFSRERKREAMRMVLILYLITIQNIIIINKINKLYSKKNFQQAYFSISI